MQKGEKGKILKNFQFHIVKSSFFDVKTYEKLTFFIIFWIGTKLCSIMKKDKKRKNFGKKFYGKIIIFWWKNLWKINFFHHFFGLAQNYAQSCRKVRKRNFLKNFQFCIVKSSFFDVKTSEKLLSSSFSWINLVS